MEKTIEKRAEEFANIGVHTGIEKSIQYTYKYAALEQQKIDIDKACEYLRNNIDKGLVIYHNETWSSLEEFINNFKKSMEAEI